MNKAKMDSDGTYDTSYESEMYCPYCGEAQSDPWEYSSDSSSVECGHCEREFDYERITSIDYTTTKVNP